MVTSTLRAEGALLRSHAAANATNADPSRLDGGPGRPEQTFSVCPEHLSSECRRRAAFESLSWSSFRPRTSKAATPIGVNFPDSRKGSVVVTKLSPGWGNSALGEDRGRVEEFLIHAISTGPVDVRRISALATWG